jgi:coenzyme F420-reducing hydrogenase delta subunit
VEYAKRLISDAGIDPLRLEMFNMSASMAHKFVDAVRAMYERMEKLGPSPLNRAGGQYPREQANPAA